MKYLGAIDQGTTSSRFIIFDEKANIVSVSQKEHKQIFPKPGLVEHCANEILKNVKFVVKNAITKANIEAKEIVSIGITNQRETFVLWNPQTGEPYGNAVVWQDTRSKEVCESLKDKKELIGQLTGLPIATYFSAPKLKQVLDLNQDLRKKAKEGKLLFGTIDTWLVWNLTGNHFTDSTNASRTMLMDLEKLEWSDELCKIFDIPKEILPKIKPSISNFGEIKDFNISIDAVLGDQHAALFGQACFNKGDLKNTYGTGCFTLLNMGKEIVRSKNGLISTVAFQTQDETFYALEGSVAIAGAAVQWLRDNLGIIKESKEVNELAAKVSDTGGVYFVPAFSGLYAPYWRDDARGVIVGLTRYSNKNHIARATLEAVAYQTKELIEAMEADTGIKIKELKVDGGMLASELLMQFQADILGVKLLCPKVIETTALGVALATGLGVGVYSSLDQVGRLWNLDKEYSAKMNVNISDDLLVGWKKSIEKSFD